MMVTERMPTRLTFAPAVLVAAFLVALALVPGARAQSDPSLGGIEDFRVAGVDADGNGRYEALVATFNATILVGGNFRFQGQFFTSYEYGPSLFNNTDVNLAGGIHALAVSIPGRAISVTNSIGPYRFDLIVYAVTDTGDFFPQGYPYASATVAYNATDFEPPEASLGTPITDEGVDTDGDGLINYLVLHVPVVVTRAVPVQVHGCVGCFGSDSLPTEFLDLTPGTHTLDIRWDGMQLRPRLSSIGGGPLPVAVTIQLPGMNRGTPLVVGQVQHTTSRAYHSADFQTPSAAIATTPTQTLRDTDRDGLADFLVIHLRVDVRASGQYIVQVQAGTPGDSRAFAVGGTTVSLAAGDRTVDVSLSGIALSRFPTTTVLAQAMVARAGATAFGVTASMTWTLSDFSPSDFETRPVSTLTVNPLAGSQGCGLAYAYDPANRFLAFGYSSGYPSTQAIPLNLYDGTFDLVVLGCGTSFVGAAQLVTVRGPTTVDVSFPSAERPTIHLAYSVPAWNRTDLTTSGPLGSLSPFYRLVADFFGNANGFADDLELRDVGSLLGIGPSGPSYFPYFPVPIRADNRSLSLVAPPLVSFSGAGQIVSSGSVRFSVRTAYRTANQPAPGDHHRLVIETPYSKPGTVKYVVTVNLAASFGGNLSVRSRLVMYDGDGFTWPANATVERTGARSWSIDVGDVPPDEPASVQLEITADAYGTAPPPGPTDLAGYLTNPLSIILIVVAGGTAVVYFALRPKRTPKAPT